jgi:ComF family protein
VGMGRRCRALLGHLDRAAKDLLLPPQCARCHCDLTTSQPIALCDDCQNVLTGSDSYCRQCGTNRLRYSWDVTSCPRCQAAKFRFDSVIPLGRYREDLRDAILEMKRPAGESLSAAVARLLAAHRERALRDFDADCLIPIPMYWGRRIWRGANSPQVLAEELSRIIGIPALPRALTRSRNTLPQKDLGHTERFRNVRGAFSLSGGYGLRDARVLVVDDIMTTGATCSEVSKVLKKGGVRAVCAVVVGRAVAKE